MYYESSESFERDRNKYYNQNLLRAGAFITSIVLSLAGYFVIINNNLIALLLLFLQLSVFINNTSIFNLYTPIVKVITRFFSNNKKYHFFEVRFQGIIGALFVILAILFLLINSKISLFFIICCLIASQLNAFFGICLACKIYPRYMIIKNKIINKTI